MQRTYRSKKDIGDGLDHRDMLLNADDKSSAFDAFYIQNIKQTKKELSCMGASNHHGHGVASNRVRKRKYVKRIVREVEPIKSLANSVFLTPDKSIHVKRPLDPFDQLLLSSPAIYEPKPVKKPDLFDQLFSEKPGKTSNRNKNVIKNFNYSSSDATDSDKENSPQQNVTQNMSNILKHKFIIEKESDCSTNLDNSVINIVNNLSLLKKNYQHNLNNSIQKTLRYNRNRLTKTYQSPMLKNSPLSSTPFGNKHRSKSIYNFSPIPVGELGESAHNVPENTNIPNDGVKSSPVTHFDNIKSKVSSRSLFSSTDKESPSNVSGNLENNKIEDNKQVAKEADIKETFDKEISFILTRSGKSPSNVSGNLENNKMEVNTELSKVAHVKETFDKQITFIQTSEAEPIMGFSVDTPANLTDTDEKEHSIVFLSKSTTRGKKVTELALEVGNLTTETNSENLNILYINKDNSDLLEYTIPSEPFLGFSNIETENNMEANTAVQDLTNSLQSDANETSEQSTVSASESEIKKESLYDTCNSEPSYINDSDIIVKEVVIAIDKMDNSLFQKYYDKMTDYESSMEDLGKENNSSKDSDEYSCLESSNLSKKSISLNECTKLNVDKSSDFNMTDEALDCASMNISEDTKQNASCGSKKELTSTDDSSDSISSYERETKRDNISNDEEDRCISFVTIRRRKLVPNNDTILVLDDSYISPSSSDCDKTVLSIKADLNEGPAHNIVNISKEEYDEFPDLSLTNRDERSVKPRRTTDEADYARQTETRAATVATIKINSIRESSILTNPEVKNSNEFEKPGIVLRPGKKWERSLSIYRRMTMMPNHFDESILEEEDLHAKGRKYRESVISTMAMQDSLAVLCNDSVCSRRSTFGSKPRRSTIRILKNSCNRSTVSLCNTTGCDDLDGFLEDCDDTVIELSKLSLADTDHEVTILEKQALHESSRAVTTERDYVLRRCCQADTIPFDECYPDTSLKNCRKIGEGVYGEVFLWRAPDGLRVMKIVPIAGHVRVNGEQQKDFGEIISEIVIAMELSALRAPIAQIECHFDEGKDVEELDLHSVENATDVFNEVSAVRCVYGSFPSRLLDLWELYDETKGSENDNPAVLPADQQYIVQELAYAGEDLESFQFASAEQAYALFLQVAFGLAVGEEAFQFEHRDLHWGNVLIAPTDQKFATFVLRGRAHRVARRGVAATIIDYSLSRLSLPGVAGALYNDLAGDDALFGAVGDYQFEVYRLMRDKLRNDWKSYEPYTNVIWLHYTVDKMITALRYKRTTTKIHKQYIAKLKGLKERILSYGSATQFVLTDNEY